MAMDDSTNKSQKFTSTGNSIFDAKYRDKLLETFRFLSNFLNYNNLKWYCAYGTALGAIRHHDIIPWDDDVDIYMPRKDYNKLLELRSMLEKHRYSISSLQDNGYYAGYFKVYNKSTTLWEAKRFPFLLGVYIDIFPLDYFNDTVESYKKKYKIYSKCVYKHEMSLARFSFSECFYHFKRKHASLLRLSLSSLLYPHFLSNYYRKKLVNQESIFSSESGNYMVSCSRAYGTKEIFPKEWFIKELEVPFNNFSVKIPIGCHQYLEQLYNNYMKLPPESKRITHHESYFVDLTESLTLDQVKKKIKQGIDCIY